MVVSSLLVSPLGWVYYAPIVTGPLIAVFRKSTVPARLTLAAGYACLLVPPISSASLGAADTVTLRSAYNWALLILLVGLLVGRTHDREGRAELSK